MREIEEEKEKREGEGGWMRFYRTGDIVKISYCEREREEEEEEEEEKREKEEIEREKQRGLLWKGRKDLQIKLNGQRVELEEIERLLSLSSLSLHSLAFLSYSSPLCERRDKEGEENEEEREGKLVAVIECPDFSPIFQEERKEERKEESKEEREKEEEKRIVFQKCPSDIETALLLHLREWLPLSLTPHKFICVSHFPLSLNHKIDRKVVCELYEKEEREEREREEREEREGGERGGEGEFGLLGEVVAKCWSEVLGFLI